MCQGTTGQALAEGWDVWATSDVFLPMFADIVRTTTPTANPCAAQEARQTCVVACVGGGRGLLGLPVYIRAGGEGGRKRHVCQLPSFRERSSILCCVCCRIFLLAYVVLSFWCRIFERDGAEIVVDDTSLEFLQGATVDYVQELIRNHFAVIDNPNTEAGCGCGVSFAPKF